MKLFRIPWLQPGKIKSAPPYKEMGGNTSNKKNICKYSATCGDMEHGHGIKTVDRGPTDPSKTKGNSYFVSYISGDIRCKSN